MQRHHRDRDMLWLTSGQPFLSWATDLANDQRPRPQVGDARRHDQQPVDRVKSGRSEPLQ